MTQRRTAQPEDRPPAAPRRGTRAGVRLADSTARVSITLGGIAVIVAVLAIFVYLLVETLPLFQRGVVREVRRLETPAWERSPVYLAVDEYLGAGLVLDGAGVARVVELREGKVLSSKPVAEPPSGISAMSHPTPAGDMALGLGDGSVMIGKVGFESDFLSGELPEPGLDKLMVGERRALADGSYVEMTPSGQLRRTALVKRFSPAVALKKGAGPVARLDLRVTSSAQYMVAVRGDGTGVFTNVQIIRPMGGGAPRAKLVAQEFEYAPPAGLPAVPDWLYVTLDGSQVLALWKDGTLQRYARARAQPEGAFVLAESADLTPSGETVTCAEMLLGAKTLVVGDSAGRVRGVFAGRGNTVRTPDGLKLAVAHEFSSGGQGSAVVSSLGISARDRSLVQGDAGGMVRVRHMTSEKTVFELDTGWGAAPAAVAISPKYDGLAAVAADGRIAVWGVDPKHPDVSFRSLFGKVWYEGDAGPSYVYQSSAGEDTAEVKYSLVPLIFGTIKATVYALLFAIPVAILAAVYTSEMLHPRVRNSVKPAIEMMASLPSVVLGFVAAMIVAPLMRDVLPAVLLSLGMLPLAAMLAGHLWQLLPVRVAGRVPTAVQLSLIGAVVLGSLSAAYAAAPWLERALFTPSEQDVLVLAGSVAEVPRAQWPESVRDMETVPPELGRALRASGLYVRSGTLVRPAGSLSDPGVAAVVARDGLDRADIRLWLDGLIGTAWAGWLLVMFAPAVALTLLLRGRLVDPVIVSMPVYRARAGAAVVEVVKFVVGVGVACSLSAAMASALTSIGLDVRDSLMGSFNQRNSLVVGLMMGFAIIPIIYTISEDSLSSVPGALRSASLGCGATRWQTAMRVVLPLALSGIFSACMIGLGRAAGETMIVLMATGNTPTMEWNIFSGVRTLSANIAVEMPEAPKDSSHYRVLFLGGLVLFALTGVINTGAEVIRRRVRAKGAGL
jgi:phosphate transport system permease protein